MEHKGRSMAGTRSKGWSRFAPPLDPEIFNNVYNAIAREARVMGRLTISKERSFVQTDAFSFQLTFRWELVVF